MSLFLPITKVDARERLVYGTISEEVPDKHGEILDYESARPAFEEWSRQFHQASGGKSLGNVRAMHGSIAAGKLTDIRFDDAAKRIDGVAKIVDEDEWQKVCEGVYTGFSIGGGYARRWADNAMPGLMRYTPTLTEVSLVDNPAVPTATFELIRSDGSVELRKLGSAPKQGSASPVSALKEGLAWLANHAKAIGASGLLSHIKALQAYLEEADEGDNMNVPQAEKALHLQIDALTKRIAQLEGQPLPAKGVLKAVGKNEEQEHETKANLNSADRTRELMKIALANPMAMV